MGEVSLAFVQCSLCLLLLLLLWIPPLTASEPFYRQSKSLAFKSRRYRLSFGLDNMPSPSPPLSLVSLRGGSNSSTRTTTISVGSSDTGNITTATTTETNTTTEESLSSFVPYNFSLFQKGDGSETDPDGIPGRFLRMQKNNRVKARAALEDTLAWRERYQVDTILSRPHAKYDVCKQILPHYFAGRDPSGHVIFVQRPGKIHVEMGTLNNVTTDDLLLHYVYILEYCWNELEPRPDQTMTSVIDLGGLHLPRIRSMFGFVKQFIQMMSHHYPQRSYKTLLINAPKWFGATYRLIAPMLRESTKSKIQILSGGKRQRQVLEECLGKFAPRELLDNDDGGRGGRKGKRNVDEELKDTTATAGGPNSPMEQMLRAFVMERLDETGKVMQPVIQVTSAKK